METANIKDFWTYCKEYIKNNVYNHVGCSVYACDFGFDLTLEINTDGCLSDLIYSGQDGAIQYLHKWWFEASEFYKYAKFEFGETHNPFEDTGGVSRLHGCFRRKLFNLSHGVGRRKLERRNRDNRGYC